MKIAQVLIQSTPPFNDFQLDLTYPEGHPRAGQALDRICLLGHNGAGKSGLMRILVDYLKNTIRYRSKGLFVVKLQLDDRFVYSVHINNNALLFRQEIEQEPMWMFELIRDGAFTLAFNHTYEKYCIGHEEEPELYDALWFENNGDDLIAFQPADYGRDRTIGLGESVQTKGHDAESYVDTFPVYVEVSPEKTTEFWGLLIFLLHRREKAWREFADRTEHRGKPEQVLRPMFEAQHPDPLAMLARCWQPYLEPLGLELDLAQAQRPTTVRDRLVLQLRDKASGKPVDYAELGTGLRRLLFNLGHIGALGFGRELKHGFLAVEEPESGLHPRLHAGLMDSYGAALAASQVLCSTHSPLVAMAFDPAERIILSTEGRGRIAARRSDCKPGADLPAVLQSDFV